MTETTPEQRREILELLADGKKIGAIKVYRDATGAGLREAKGFVEDLIDQLPEDARGGLSGASQKSGCSAALVLIAALIAAASLI